MTPDTPQTRWGKIRYGLAALLLGLPIPIVILAFLAPGELKLRLHGPTGVEPRADLSRKACARHGRRIGRRAVPSEKLDPVARECALRLADIEKGDPPRKFRVVGVPR